MRSSLQSKEEYALLQQLRDDGEREDDGSSKILWKERHGYVAVGILDEQKTGRVWILLNASHEPLLKKVSPHGTYSLTSQELRTILETDQVNEVVLAELTRQVSKRG